MSDFQKDNENLDETASVGGIDKDPIVKEAIKRYKITQKYHKKNYKWMDDDNKFAAGTNENAYQWDQNQKKKLETVGLNALTINVIPKFISDIEGDMRMNRARFKFLPTGGHSTKIIADIFEGIGRKIERDSNAESVYDRVGHNMLRMGLGYALLETEYLGKRSFHKRIVVKLITNPLTVYPDPRPYDIDNAKMRYCFITRWIPKSEYKEKYGPLKEGVEWTGDATVSANDWYGDKSLRIAHYYRLVPETVTYVQLSNGAIMTKDKALDEIARLELNITESASTNPMTTQLVVDGILKAPTIVEEKEVDCDRVEMYVIDGARVLEGPFDIPGDVIPIVGCYGRQDVIEGVKYFKGITRDLRTQQIELNYLASTSINQMSTGTTAKYFMTATQIRGWSAQYQKSAAITTFALPYNFETEPGTNQVAPPPILIPPQTVNVNLLQAIDAKMAQMRTATGFGEPMQIDQGVGNQSGKALLIRQKTLDKGLYCWIDNHNKFIAGIGRVALGMIPEVYCEDRMERILGVDGKEEDVQINGLEMDPMLNLEYRINDLSAGDYDVSVDTGPSYSTKRIETKEDIKEIMALYPDKGFALADIYARNSDWPESDEIEERFGHLIDQQFPGMRKPDPKKPPRQVPPSPQMQVAQQELQSRMIQASSAAQTAQSKAELAKLKVAEEAAKLGMDSEKFKTLVLAIIQEWIAGAGGNTQGNQGQQPPGGTPPVGGVPVG